MTIMMMMKSCSPVMIVAITPFGNPTRVVQDVGPNSLMMMRMITRNPHLAEAVGAAGELLVFQVVVCGGSRRGGRREARYAPGIEEGRKEGRKEGKENHEYTKTKTKNQNQKPKPKTKTKNVDQS